MSSAVSVGGPIRKIACFFFANYEGRRDREGVEELRRVPTTSYRQGILTYYVDGAQGTATLTPTDLKNMDPLGVGENQAVLATLQKYPLPNDPTLNDRLNQQGFRFVANEARKFDTYIAKLDYKITRDGRHTIFWRANLQNDNSGGAPQFPGRRPQRARSTTARALHSAIPQCLTRRRSIRSDGVLQDTAWKTLEFLCRRK